MVAWATNRWRSIWHLGLTLRSGAALFFAVGCVGIATALRIGLGRISPTALSSLHTIPRHWLLHSWAAPNLGCWRPR